MPKPPVRKSASECAVDASRPRFSLADVTRFASSLPEPEQRQMTSEKNNIQLALTIGCRLLKHSQSSERKRHSSASTHALGNEVYHPRTSSDTRSAAQVEATSPLSLSGGSHLSVRWFHLLAHGANGCLNPGLLTFQPPIGHATRHQIRPEMLEDVKVAEKL